MWNYSNLPAAFDKGSFSIGIKVTTEEELDDAMKLAIREKDKLVFIEACIPGRDCSKGLERLGESFMKAQQKI